MGRKFLIPYGMKLREIVFQNEGIRRLQKLYFLK